MRIALSIWICLLSFAASAQFVPFTFLGRKASAAAPASTTPTMIQNFSLSSTRNDGGNIFTNTGLMRIPISEATQPGNAMILTIGAAGNASAALGVSDDQTNTWTLATYGQDTGNRQHIWMYFALNIRTNTHRLFVTNISGFALTNFTAAGTEFNNIASSSALDGTNTASGAATTTASAGSITPVNSGNLFYQYTIVDAGTRKATSFSAGSQANIGWQLLSADLNDGTATQWGIYSNTAALNPQLTMPSGSHLSAAISLKTASQGVARPAGMQIVSTLHQSVDNNISSPIVSHFPTVGNLLVQAFQGGSAAFRITNVTDSATNTWREAVNGTATNGAGTSHFWYATNTSSASTLRVTNWYQSTAVGHGTIMLYDIVGAATDPFDYATWQTNFQSVAGTLTSPPGLTPSTAGGVVICQTEQDFNTVTGVTSTASSIWLDVAVWDGNNLDGPSNLDENNGWAHVKNLDNTTTVAPVWSYQSASANIAQNTASMISFMPVGGVRLHPSGFVQSAQAATASGTSQTCAFTNNNTVGNLITVGMRIGANGRTITVTDTKGNTYTAAVGGTTDGQGDDMAVYYATNCAAGPNTVTVAISGAAASIRYAIGEYAGLSRASPVDKTATATFSGSSSPSVTLGSTTTTPRQLLYVLMVDGTASSSAYTAPDHYTIRETISGRVVTQDTVVSAAGTYTGSLSWTGGSSSGGMVMVTFK